MVVIEGGREHVGQDVAAAVTSVLQTSAGRMVFGRFERGLGGEAQGPPKNPSVKRQTA
jgi:hypothetical protein